MRARAFPIVSAVALLAGCTVLGPDYAPPQTFVGTTFSEVTQEGLATPGAPVAAWWTTFGDPVLDGLVARAVRANPGLRAAQARVREARARSDVAQAGLFPTANASASAERDRTADMGEIPGATTNLFRAGFDAAWEIDVFGGVRRAIEAADAEVGASVEDRRAVLVSLLSEVARNYVELRGAQRQSAIAQANLQAQRETLEFTRKRLSAGMATDLDVARAESQVQATASTVPEFETAERQAIHALGVLVGVAPDALSAELTPPAAIPAAPPEVPVGLQSDLLRRRPDVRRAERQLAAATARIGAAEADWFPRFSLTGALGLASDRLGDLIDTGSRTASARGLVSWPILDFGKIRGNVEATKAREEQALANYESAVLTSLREVDDALVALAKERTRRVSLAAAETASRRASDLARQVWEAGRADFLSVLDAQRQLLAAQDALVQSDRRAATDLVALYKALGGGWEVEAEADEKPRSDAPGARVVEVASPVSR